MPRPKANGSETSSRQQILHTQVARWTSKRSTVPKMQKSLEKEQGPIWETAKGHVHLCSSLRWAKTPCVMLARVTGSSSGPEGFKEDLTSNSHLACWYLWAPVGSVSCLGHIESKDTHAVTKEWKKDAGVGDTPDQCWLICTGASSQFHHSGTVLSWIARLIAPYHFIKHELECLSTAPILKMESGRLRCGFKPQWRLRCDSKASILGPVCCTPVHIRGAHVPAAALCQLASPCQWKGHKSTAGDHTSRWTWGPGERGQVQAFPHSSRQQTPLWSEWFPVGQNVYPNSWFANN